CVGLGAGCLRGPKRPFVGWTHGSRCLVRRPGRLPTIRPIAYRVAVLLDTPRLLARNSTREHPMLGTGYTDEPGRALREEPEAVSVEDQQLLAARARRDARVAQLAEWELRRKSIQREIDWLHSQRFQQDVSKGLRVLRRQLARLDRMIQGG